MDNSVLSSLLRINRQRIRALRRALLPYGYVGNMHLILFYVGRHPGASQEDITCFYALDKTSVARDSKRLEDMGHLRRDLVPENRRQYQLFLTPAGLDMLEVLKRTYDDFENRLSAGVSPQDWQTITRLLKQLEDNSC